MYCSNCGAKCSDGGQFCIKCGQKLAHDNNKRSRPDDSSEQINFIRDTASKDSNGLLAEEETTLKIKFPAAGIFFALHGILFLYLSMHQHYIPVGPYVGFAYFNWHTWIILSLLLVSTMLLFLRKIRLFSVALLAYSIWHIFYYTVAYWEFPNNFPNYYPRGDLSGLTNILLVRVILTFSYGTLAFLAIMALRKGNKFSSITKKIWCIPGILFCMATTPIILAALSKEVIRSLQFLSEIVVKLVCPATEIMFSGWWLTHPYRVQGMPVHHIAPAAQATSQYSMENMTPKAELKLDNDVITIEREAELIAKPDLSRADMADASKSRVMPYYTGVAWEEMMQETDASWCTQSKLEELADYGRMRIKEGAFDAPFGMQAVLEKKANEISQYIAEVIPKIQKPFDMSVKYPIINDGKMERGLIKFDGWRLDHFKRLYIFNNGNPASSYNITRAWDYCLGRDGKLYMVYSVSGKYDDNQKITDLRYWIYDLLPYDAMFLENKNQNMVVSVSHGLLYTLDAIPKERTDNVIVDRGNEKDIFNFPLQLKDYGYPETGEGILVRINALL